MDVAAEATKLRDTWETGTTKADDTLKKKNGDEWTSIDTKS